MQISPGNCRDSGYGKDACGDLACGVWGSSTHQTGGYYKTDINPDGDKSVSKLEELCYFPIRVEMECPANSIGNIDELKCNCNIGYYGTEGNCTKCPDSKTTSFIGTTSMSGCVADTTAGGGASGAGPGGGGYMQDDGSLGYNQTTSVSPHFNVVNDKLNDATNQINDLQNKLDNANKRARDYIGQTTTMDGEDLYILKSQIVPPVCPVCPSITGCADGGRKCAPCPSCERCPEPAFECISVPDYPASAEMQPRAILTDFSTFGL